MAKTIFVEGSILTPSYVQSIYGTGADSGHLHDGIDEDGHSSKIAGDSGITGVIGLESIPPIPVDTGLTGLITMAGTTGIEVDQAWCVGVTGSQTIIESKEFSAPILLSEAAVPDSQASIKATHIGGGYLVPNSWKVNSVIVQPLTSETYTKTIAFTVAIPADGIAQTTGLGWDFRFTDGFFISAVVAIEGRVVPWKLQGFFSGTLLNTFTEKKAYAVPYNYNGGTSYPNGVGGAGRHGYAVLVADSALNGTQVSLEAHSSNVIYLNSSTGVAVTISGTISVAAQL